MIAPFEGSRLKFDRAAKHVAELEHAIAAYFAEKPCRLVVEPFPLPLPHLRCQAWVTRITKPVPLELASIIGDIVHNLRTSLDMLACDLVSVKGHQPRKVYFPFCDREDDLNGAIKKCRLHLAGDDVVRAVKDLAPYRGGNVALRMLHDMDIADKHRALLPVLGGASVPLGPILKASPTFAVQTWSSLIVDGHKVIMLQENLSPVRVGDELPADWFLAFGEIAGLGSVRLAETLQWLSAATREAFDKLTGLRPGATFPT